MVIYNAALHGTKGKKMNGLWLAPAHKTPPLHESITKRKLIWWRFIISNTSPPPPSFFCVCVWYKCTLSRILNVPCLYRLWTDLIIYQKKEREKKMNGRFLSLLNSSVTFLVLYTLLLPLAHFPPSFLDAAGRTGASLRRLPRSLRSLDSSDTIEGYYSHLLNLLP